MSTTPYNQTFFSDLIASSSRSARVIAPLLVAQLRPRSIVDIGCGAGSWLAEFTSLGVNDFVGVDGDYVDRSSLRIAADRFVAKDLAATIDLGRRFDLAFCLEVGEHLHEAHADTLVDSIARHSDAVLFSAAIPHQGGTAHVNEQWPAYWAKKFSRCGYTCFDWIRWVIWNDTSVSPWFRQNLLIYLREGAIARLPVDSPLLKARVDAPQGVVHPDFFTHMYKSFEDLQALEKPPHLKWSLKALAASARASLRYRSARALGR